MSDDAALEGIWRLVSSKAWDEHGKELPPPYGPEPSGHISFANGRMLAALCRGEAQLPLDTGRSYSSYGGPYSIADDRLEVQVDVASDPARIGGSQVRRFTLSDDELVLRPPLRLYGASREQRELRWRRVWTPLDTPL